MVPPRHSIVQIAPPQAGAAPRATQAAAWQHVAGVQSESLLQASLPTINLPSLEAAGGADGRSAEGAGTASADALVAAVGFGITIPGPCVGRASGRQADSARTHNGSTVSRNRIRPSCLASDNRARSVAGAALIRLFALVGVVGISFSAVFVRLAHVSPSTAAFFRGAYAIPVLYALWLLVRKHDRRSVGARLLAFVAGLFLATDLAFWHRSIAYIGAGLATVLANTQIAFVGVLAWVLHKERPKAVALVMVPVVFGGVVLISGLGRADAYGSEPLRGSLLGAFSGLAYSGFLLVYRRANRALSHPAGPLLDATIGTTVGALASSVFDPGFNLVPIWPAHGWLLLLALVAQVAGWLMISIALPRLPALETSVLLLLQPTCTVLWGFLLFNERLSVAQLAGAGVVLLGVLVLSLRGSVEQQPTEAPLEVGP